MSPFSKRPQGLVLCLSLIYKSKDKNAIRLFYFRCTVPPNKFGRLSSPAAAPTPVNNRRIITSSIWACARECTSLMARPKSPLHSPCTPAFAVLPWDSWTSTKKLLQCTQQREKLSFLFVGYIITKRSFKDQSRMGEGTEFEELQMHEINPLWHKRLYTPDAERGFS